MLGVRSDADRPVIGLGADSVGFAVVRAAGVAAKARNPVLGPPSRIWNKTGTHCGKRKAGDLSPAHSQPMPRTRLVVLGRELIAVGLDESLEAGHGLD